MTQIKTKCGLCEKEDLLFKYDFTYPLIQKSFFIINQKLCPKDDIEHLEICILCAHKLELSSQIVREYEEMCNRNNRVSPTKCFFCEYRTSHLVDFNKNPAQVQEKITAFLDSVGLMHDHKNCKGCLSCLYKLDVWFELRSKVYRILHISEAELVANNNGRRVNITSRRSKSEELSPARGKLSTERRSGVTNKNSPVTPSQKKNNNAKNIITSTPVRPRPASKRTKKDERQNWHQYLCNKLKDLPTVDELQKDSFNLNTNIRDETDWKLLNAIPFVKIRIAADDAETPIIIVSSDEDEPEKQRRTTRRRTLSAKKQVSNDSVKRNQSTKKNLIKIKFPIKSKQANSSQAERSIDSNSIGNNDPESFFCNICDKNFTVRCEYLSHKMKHDQPDDLIVKVLREPITEVENPERRAPISPEEISSLLTKWVGEHAAKIYEDADKSLQSCASTEDDTVEQVIETEEIEKLQLDESEYVKSVDNSLQENEKQKCSAETVDDSPTSANNSALNHLNEYETSGEKDENNEAKNKESDDEPSQRKELDEREDSEEIHGEIDQTCKSLNVDNDVNEEENVSIAGESSKEGNDAEPNNQLIEQADECVNTLNEDGQKNTESESIAIEIASIIELHSSQDETTTDHDAAVLNNSTEQQTSLIPVNGKEEILQLESDNLTDEINTDTLGAAISDNDNNKDIQRNSEELQGCNNSENSTNSVMTREDLLNILESNMESEGETFQDSATPNVGKRKRIENEEQEELTPKRKRVRFADEAEVIYGDNIDAPQKSSCDCI